MTPPMQRSSGTSDAVRAHVLVIHTQHGDPDALAAFAQSVTGDTSAVLEEATGVPWTTRSARSQQVSGDDPHDPADFLDAALLEMVETPADAVIVVTDAPLLSRRQVVVPGLASPTANVVVLSTGPLTQPQLGQPARPLDDAVVVANAATLLAHLIGHLIGMEHGAEGAMRPFEFDPERAVAAPLIVEGQDVRRGVERLHEGERETPGAWRRLATHTSIAVKQRREALGPAVRSRAPLLPLRLGKLTAAAIIPVFIILFTEEFWFVASHLERWRVWLVAALAVLGGTVFMLLAQRLLFPHRDRKRITQHVALTNAAVVVNTFVLMFGLILTVSAIVLLIELLLFPADYIRDWFEQRYVITLADHAYLALIVGSIATVSGALGGSFHGRALLREYGLFLDQP